VRAPLIFNTITLSSLPSHLPCHNLTIEMLPFQAAHKDANFGYSRSQPCQSPEESREAPVYDTASLVTGRSIAGSESYRHYLAIFVGARSALEQIPSHRFLMPCPLPSDYHVF